VLALSLSGAHSNLVCLVLRGSSSGGGPALSLHAAVGVAFAPCIERAEDKALHGLADLSFYSRIQHGSRGCDSGWYNGGHSDGRRCRSPGSSSSSSSGSSSLGAHAGLNLSQRCFVLVGDTAGGIVQWLRQPRFSAGNFRVRRLVPSRYTSNET
jgi:hypothetical protein